MNIIKLSLFTFILVACSNLSADNFKPVFYPEYFTGLETENVVKYENAKLDYDLTNSNNKNIHFSSCPQVDAVKDDDVLTSEYHLLTMLRLNCNAMKKYTIAGSANKSFLAELIADKNINNLPATAYPYVNNYDKKTRAGKTLKSYQKKLIAKVSSDGTILVETETDNLIYNIISIGDFNGDKIQDALIRIDWHVISAFGKGSKLVLITKKTAESNFEEIFIN